MSKPSTSGTKNPPQLPTKSAWSRGPPSASSTQSPRSQSPAPSPSTPTAPSHQGGHSRKPSALGQSVPFKDGVSIPRNNVGSVKQGSSVTFGSIDEPSAPISSSPAAVPSIKPDVPKTFGSVPVSAAQLTNGKSSASSVTSVPSSSSKAPSISTPPSSVPSTSSTPPASTPPTPVKQKPKMDVRSLFKGSSAPAQPQQETSSPAARNSALPGQPQPPSIQAPAASSSSQPGGSHPVPFVPRGQVGTPVPPRSPVFNRHPTNGAPPRPGVAPPTPGGQPPMGSPRMAPNQQHQVPPAGMPPPQWPAYYYYGDPNYPQMYHPQQWYMPPPPHGHQMPPQGTPGPPPHQGLPMSPRNAPPPLPAPGTPTPPHAVPASPHIPHATPSHSHSSSITSPPPPTPGTPTGSAGVRLNTNANTFVPTQRRGVTIKHSDGTEVKLQDMRKPSPTPGGVSGSPSNDFATATASPARKSVVRLESEDDRKKRLAEEHAREEEARKLKEKEKEEQDAKTRAEEKKKEDEEKAKREGEEKARKAEEEKERQRVEEEERKKAEAEQAQKAKEDSDRLKQEAEQKKKEDEERQKQESEKKAAEDAERQKQETKRKEEEEAAKAKAEAESKESPAKASGETSKDALEDGEVAEDKTAASVPSGASSTASKDALRINTISMPPPSGLPTKMRPHRPGPLDLSGVAKQDITAPLPSALATARIIDDLGSVSYPDGILSPKIELNANAQPGKFRYDRDFLLQFMSICKEKPDSLPALDAIGIEPSEQNFSLSRGGSGRHRTSSTTGGPSRQNSMSFGPGPLGKQQFPTMGSFGTAPKTSEERFIASNPMRSISVSGGNAPFGRPAMTRTASQGGSGPLGSNRNRSRRGEKRGDGKGPGQPSQLTNVSTAAGIMGLEPVAPLEKSQNAWAPASIGKKAPVDSDAPEVVDRKVKSLLNKLTMEKFDSISDQIIAWANKSESEKDGRTLIQVIRLVFEKATDEAAWSEMYARLCRKMMERISAQVKDDGIKAQDGKPIAGGNLFRKYLLNRCQEDFERGWAAKDAAAAAASSKAETDNAAKENAAKGEDGEEIALYSDEYYASQKAKRRGLGLIRFIGELFKLQMLTERIMHECVQKLVRNVENPEEEEIESLCKLLGTVGGILDANQKARTHMDVYFTRIKELAKTSNVSSRMQFMLQDVVELRARGWVSRNQVAAPATIAQVHEAAAKEKAAQEKENYQRTLGMSRGGSKRGQDRGEVGPDGWTVQGGPAPVRPPPKAGDLSKFGTIGASKGSPITNFGPSSVFNKNKIDSKRESISRSSSSSNMFSMLQASENAADAAASSGPAEPTPQRKKLILQPRTKGSADGEATPSESRVPSPTEAEAPAEMSEADAKRKLDEDLKEFKSIRNLDEGEEYFRSLPAAHHALLVDKFVSWAVESKEADAQLVADLFARGVSKSLCTSSAFETGFATVAELIGDIAIDAPKAPNHFATMVKASELGEEERSRIVEKSLDYEAKLRQLLL